VQEDVLAYLVPRMERSFEGARRLAVRLDALALAEGKPVTRRLARRALDDEGTDSVSED
jgi:chromosomal replication initiation ATPase DnaA